MRITEAYIFFLVELFFLFEKHDIFSLMIFVSVIMLAMSDPQRCGDIILPNYKMFQWLSLETQYTSYDLQKVCVSHMNWECTRSSIKSAAILEFPFWKVAVPGPDQEFCPILFPL